MMRIFFLTLIITHLHACSSEPASGDFPTVAQHDHTHHEMEPASQNQNAWPEDSKLSLTWMPGDDIALTGYRIYAKKDGSADFQQLSDLNIADSPSAAGTEPSHVLSIHDSDFLSGLNGQKVCFVISALSAAGESPPSEQQCIDLQP